MSILEKVRRYESMVRDFKALAIGEEFVFLLEGRAYVIKKAEVDDLERVARGRVIGD
jgi:hypothetical protein